MANTPFTWGPGGQKITSPEAAARQRQIAEALIAQSATPADNWASGLGDVAAALSGTVLQGRADEAEQAGRERAGGLFADLAVNQDPNAIIAALTSPDAAWASPAQTSIASALLNSGLERQDPMYQLQLQQAQLELDRARNPVAEPFTLGEGQIRFGGDGSVLVQGLPSSPETIINTGDNSGAFTKKGDEYAAERLSGIVEGGFGAQQMMGDLQALTAIGSQINTGKTAEIMRTLGPYAQALGVPIDGLGEGQAYQAIIDRMAPQMRPAGSGSSSDTDVRMFLSSLPQLGNTPEGNQIITQTMTALQEHKIAAAEIASQAFDGTKSWQEAEAEIRSLPNPYEGFNRYKQAIGGGAPSALPSGVTIRRLD